MGTSENWSLNYFYQQLYCEFVNIFGVPLRTSPVKIFIRHSSLWRFPITPKYHTFHSIIKSSLLILLCILAHLCKGTPLQPLRIHFFGIRGPRSQLGFMFSLFAGRVTRWKSCTNPMSALRYPMYLNRIETHNTFSSFLFRIISVHSMEKNRCIFL